MYIMDNSQITRRRIRTARVIHNVSRPNKKKTHGKKTNELTGAINKTKKSSILDKKTKMGEFLDKIENFPNFRSFNKDFIKTNFIENTHAMRHARAITGDFIQILQNEKLTPNEKKTGLIASRIAKNCDTNLQKSAVPFCFCCGNIIKIDKISNKPLGVSCDHVIPIITMLMTVKPESVPDNLHYIHSKCNSNKLNKNIFEVYENIGLPGGIFSECKINTVTKCREKFLQILSSLNFRSESDIAYRINCLPMFNKDIDEIKKKYSLFLNDEREAAILLTKLKNTSF